MLSNKYFRFFAPVTVFTVTGFVVGSPVFGLVAGVGFGILWLGYTYFLEWMNK